MSDDLSLSHIRKKHRHHLTSTHGGSDDFPIVFSGALKKGTIKNVFKIGHDLKIKSHEAKEIKVDSEKEKILIAKSMNIGYYLITPLIAGVFFGFWLDKVFNTKPILLLLFFTLGVVGSFYNLWKAVKESK